MIENCNIAIVQIYNNNIKDYAEYSRLINSIYASKHGYKYVCWNYDLVPTQISCYYNKIQAIAQAMKSNGNFEWILYLDSDACVSNHDIKIEDIVARHENKELIFGRDINGSNNGVFLIKNTEKMYEYLQKSFSDNRFFHTKFPEQSAMFAHAGSQEYKELVDFEEAMFFNAYLNVYTDFKKVEKYFNNDSFILHMARMPDNIRINIFIQILQKYGIYCQIKRKGTKQWQKEKSN